MRPHKRAVLLSAVCLGLIATSASAETLGASLTRIEHAYPEAVAIKIGGQNALELKDVDYGGVHWARVDFTFDAGGHLARMTMDARDVAYDTVMKLAEVQMQTPTPPTSGVAHAEDDASPDVQIRVCEGENGHVTMTFEPVSLVS